MPGSMSRSQSSHDLHTQLMWAAERSDTFFPLQSPGSSNASLMTASSKLSSSLRRKLTKRRPSTNSMDPTSPTSFHPMPQTPVADVRPRKKSNQPLPQEALETVMKNVDAIVSAGYLHPQKAPPAVTQSLPDLEPAVAQSRPPRPSTSPAANVNNIDKSRRFVPGDPSSPYRVIQRTANTKQFAEDNILPPDPFARPLPSRSKSYSDMREASRVTRPPVPKMPLTPPMPKLPSEVSPTVVAPGRSVPELRRRSSTVIAYYAPPSFNPGPPPAQQPHEKRIAESFPTINDALGRKFSSPRSLRQASSSREPFVGGPVTRPAPPPYVSDYGFVDGMWQESQSPTESSHDLPSPRAVRSASEPGVPPSRIRPHRSFRRPTISNDSPSAPSTDSHGRTPSELSIFPYTPFLNPEGASPRANKTARPLETKEPSRPAPQNGFVASPISGPSPSRPIHSHAVSDRPAPEEIERRAISKYRDMERGRFREDVTTTFSRSRHDARDSPVSEHRKPSAQRSAMTAVLI